MVVKGQISVQELASRIQHILDDIEQDGSIWQIATGQPGGDFVLVPAAIAGEVIGLCDAEYGWPVEVRVDGKFAPEDLIPRSRRHPFLVRSGRRIAGVIQRSEYRDIRRKMVAAQETAKPWRR